MIMSCSGTTPFSQRMEETHLKLRDKQAGEETISSESSKSTIMLSVIDGMLFAKAMAPP